MEKKYIVAIDLGVSNIVIAVATPTVQDLVESAKSISDIERGADRGVLNLEYITSLPSEGFMAGKIDNIELAAKSISRALDKVREELHMDIYELYVGVSGESIYCTGYTDHVFVPDSTNGVTQQDVKALFDRMQNVQVAEGKYIMERIPQNYVVDDTRDVKNPVGTFGSRLSSTFNFIISDNTPLQRVDMALRRQNIKLRRLFSNAVVVGDAVLTPDEKEEGVAVVDIGGGLTNIAIYYRNVVRYISTIPMGANTINNDIRTLMIPERYIEKLKLRYGYALAEAAPESKIVITGRTKRETKEIVAYNLAAVIEARTEQIAEFVKHEIKDSGYEGKLPYGIVLTGGSAQLRKIDELFRRTTGYDVRIAEAEDVISPETRSKITSTSESTVVGLLLHGLKHGYCDVVVNDPPEPEPEVEVEVAPEPVRPRFTPPPPPQRPVVRPVVPQPVKTPASVSDEPEVAPLTINSIKPPVVAEQSSEAVQEQIAALESEDNNEPEQTTPQEPQAAKPRRNFMNIFGNIVSKVSDKFDVSDDDDDMI